LAREGVRFEKAYTPVPITLPAHAVLFTGKYPMGIGMHDFSGNRLSAEHATLASLLAEEGYATSAIVGSAVLDSRFGLDRGFEHYYDNFDFSRLHEMNLDAMERRGDQVMDEALAWLEKNHQKPFFLWVHLYDPHHPYQPPPPYDTQYKQRPYDGEIAFADAQVGRILEFLRDSKLYDRSLIALAGDHGEGLGEHAEKTHGFFIYESTVRIPLLLKLPAGQAMRSKVVSTPVSLADVAPTLLRLAGLRVPAEMQGKSMVSLLEGQRPGTGEGLYGETFLPRLHFNWSELRSVHFGNYHFIDAPKPELYDLSQDPAELHDLFGQKKRVAQDLRARLGRLVQKYSPPAGRETVEQTGLDPALLERLKSLGYAAVSGGGDLTISNRNLPDPKDRIQMYEMVSEAIADSQRGRYQASNEKLLATFKIEKDSLPVHYLLALNYYRQENFTQAIEQFQQVLKLSPDYSLAVYYLGLAYGKAGDFDQAIVTLQRSLQLDSTNFSAAYNLGAAYLKKGKVPEAVEALEKSVNIYPEYAPGHAALGEVLLYQGRVDEAIRSLRKAVSLAPQDARARQALSRALQVKEANGNR
jgi:arylsulfatase A-like enzyme/Flp pilus assembly protein TadD